MPRKLRIGYPRAIRVAADRGNYAQTGQDATFSLAAGAITPEVYLDYVDTSGVKQRTLVNNDGSTSINIRRYAGLHVDASGTRTTVDTGDDERGAFENIGYGINWGEELGTTWTTDGRSKDIDSGPPIFGRVYTTTGAKTVTMAFRDTANNTEEITFTVNVAALGTATNISATTGAWPAFTSNTVYSLNRGSDYSARGTINLDGHHNVVFIATGSGAAPIVSAVRLDTSIWDNTANAPRTRGCALVDLNISGAVDWLTHGIEYCTVFRCSVGRFAAVANTFYFDDAISLGRTENETNNVRYARGLFVQESEAFSRSDGHVWFGTMRHFHWIGSTINKNAATSGVHIFRGVMEASTFRHTINKATASTAAGSYFKIQGQSCLISSTPDTWRDDCRMGDYALQQSYGYPTRLFCAHQVQFGDAGDVQPTFNVGLGPQNALSTEPPEGVELSTYEDCVWYRAGSEPTLGNCELRGRNLSGRNLRRDRGTGSYVTIATNPYTPDRIPPGWNGPYTSETTNTRPVPVGY